MVNKTSLQSDRDQERERPQPAARTRWGAWNWFGAAFGATVLIGAGSFYLAGRTDSGADVSAPIGESPATVSTIEQQPVIAPVHDEADEHEADEQEVVEHADGTTPPDDTTATSEAGEVQVIAIEMFEFGYTPATIDIQAGVPVVFRVTNTGKLPHEAMVGDAHMQEEFAAVEDHDDGHGDEADGHHGDLMATLVQPGETQDLEVLIDEPGTWYMACHLLGHYEAGQIATINVTG